MRTDELVERLLATEHRGRYEHGGGCVTSDGKVTSWGGGKIMELRNPDGAEAAAEIRRLSRQVKAARSALSAIGAHDMGLAEDRNRALAALAEMGEK